MADALKSFAISTVATAPSPAASGTSLVVAAGHGARFPATPFNATVCPAAATPDPTNAEIVRVTNISTDTLTIEREQEGTSARTIGTGDLIFQGVTPKMIEDPRAPANHDHASNKLAQSNTHESPDTDTAPTALHHTLGTDANQAAAGNHNHSGVYEPVQTAASKAEMEAGTETAIRSMTPQRVAQAIAALNEGTDTYARFTPANNYPPASNYATFDTRNSILVLDFDDGATNEESVFVGIMPEAAALGSGLKVRIYWMATTATIGNCRWGVQFADLSDQDIDGLTFDTAAEAHTATSGTSGIAVVTEITITDIDNIVAGVPFALKVYRDSSDTTNDTMTGDAELVAVEVRSAS